MFGSIYSKNNFGGAYMRLLLAEDEKELAKALSVILKHNSYSVDVVHNGEDALCYLENGDYDGAILDIMMPKLDGLSVLKRIREGNAKICKIRQEHIYRSDALRISDLTLCGGSQHVEYGKNKYQ